MPIISIIKYIAGAVVLITVGGTAYVVKDFTGGLERTPAVGGKSSAQVELALKAKSERMVELNNAPGEKALRKAQRLLSEGLMAEAEERLKYVSSYYPTAKSATRARRILGEMNLDRLLDPNKKQGKTEIVVKSGDNYSRIVERNKTTMDSLVYFSGLEHASSRTLHPGDKLTVMPLEMRAVINVRRGTFTIFDKDTYVKEYPILASTYKGGDVEGLTISSIKGVSAGKTLSSHREGYITADKMMTLSNKSLVIRSDAEDAQQGFSFGFTLAQADMAELPLLLRPGSDIQIKQ